MRCVESWELLGIAVFVGTGVKVLCLTIGSLWHLFLQWSLTNYLAVVCCCLTDNCHICLSVLIFTVKLGDMCLAFLLEHWLGIFAFSFLFWEVGKTSLMVLNVWFV